MAWFISSREANSIRVETVIGFHDIIVQHTPKDEIRICVIWIVVEYIK